MQKKFNKKAVEYYNGKMYDKNRNTPVRKMFCVECDKYVEAIKSKGSVVYENRPDLKDKVMYYCPYCHNYASNVADVIPNRTIRQLRKRIHGTIDPLWQSGMVSRGWVYRKMSDKLGYQFHNGSIRTVAEGFAAHKAAVEIAQEVNSNGLKRYLERKRNKGNGVW